MAQPPPLHIRTQDLHGKVALITGASRGIGRAVAMSLASRGCSILGTCSSSTSLHSFSSMNEEIQSLYNGSQNRKQSQSQSQSSHPDASSPTTTTVPPRIIGIEANIFSPTCPSTITTALQTHFSSQLNIFISNAADAVTGTIGALTPEEVQRSLTGNIQTPVLIVDELVRHKMFQPESRIIYISSVRARQPWAEQLMYAAGKSAGESLCRTWSMAFGGRDDRYTFMTQTTANAVTVGLTETDSVMQCPPDILEGFKNEFIPLQSMPRMGQPDDVADVVGLLCSREARWITGTVVSASGGGVKIG